MGNVSPISSVIKAKLNAFFIGSLIILDIFNHLFILGEQLVWKQEN